MKDFKKLNKKEQQDIRKKYKNKFYRNYRYSINLFIIYTILGIFSLTSIFIAFNINFIIGAILFCLFFIIMLILLILLNKSNDAFKKYLESIGYK